MSGFGVRSLIVAITLASADALKGSRGRAKERSAALSMGTHLEPHELESYSFDAFVQEFNKPYAKGTEEWEHRQGIFNARREDAIAHQSQSERTWSKGINKFTDYTDGEFRKLLGYKRSKRGLGSLPMGVNLAASRPSKTVELPTDYRAWTPKSILGAQIRDQGSCGSCWAEAAMSVLEAHLENNEALWNSSIAHLRTKFHGQLLGYPVLPSEPVIQCTPNPRHCGGTGGCEGATVELAYDYVKKHGVPFQKEVQEGTFTQRMGTDCEAGHTAKFGISGYAALPSNKVNPLLEALVMSNGPVAVTVDASNWMSYSGGIFSDSKSRHPSAPDGDFTVNHAVSLFGYGVTPNRKSRKEQLKYYTIKNSWGPSWGAEGFIYLQRKDKEDEWCGWDYKPKDGIACDGDPPKAWVCGTCGILYDSVYPIGLHLRD